MFLGLLFSTSAIGLLMLGIVIVMDPSIILRGVLPTGAPDALIAYIHTPAAIIFGIAALNWMTRNAGASDARNAVIQANIIWFGLAVILHIFDFFSSSQRLMLVFAAIDLFYAVAFFWVWRKDEQPSGYSSNAVQ